MTKSVWMYPLILCLVSLTSAQTPHGPTACGGWFFPIGKGGSAHCCWTGKDLYHTFRGGVGHRVIGKACTMGNGSTNCDNGGGSLPKCFFGPCGVHIAAVQYGMDAIVFKPTSQPLVCGRALVTKFPLKHLSFPEPYTNQPPYPAVTATCIYRKCAAGVPTQ
jgi:hypothetical protein